ncbi:hypothetical protein RMSM_03387 [Rhodopirellula maiorica SM1]|uniref:Uncharacterized protein n=1 Tax=Rhodopirellula maiorica SM1 TaxID=1265738 RepID=M5RWE3_9BACT|nr:hypothetical protein RMSM_03387 [Rhodopirellula maiorica SM1]
MTQQGGGTVLIVPRGLDDGFGYPKLAVVLPDRMRNLWHLLSRGSA